MRKVLQEFSPTVVMASLDEAYLDFSGTDRLYPVSLLPVAESIRDRVRDATGLDCSVGIGGNRMIAKLASDYAKPRGLMEVRAGWEEGFLAGLPLSALPGVGPVTAARWKERGLTEVAQVQAMSESELHRQVGDAASSLKRRAHGHGGMVLRSGRLQRSVSRETTMSRDERRPERLETLLTLFAARIGSQLRKEGLVARTVALKLRHDDFRTVTRRVTLREGTNLDAELLKPALELFRKAFEEVRRRDRGVRLIGISATNLAEAAEADLFEPEERQRSRRLTDAVDQLRNRYGFDAVTVARLLGTKRRE